MLTCIITEKNYEIKCSQFLKILMAFRKGTIKIMILIIDTGLQSISLWCNDMMSQYVQVSDHFGLTELKCGRPRHNIELYFFIQNCCQKRVKEASHTAFFQIMISLMARYDV